MFVQCYRPPVHGPEDFATNWRMWWNGEPKARAWGWKIETVASMEPHPKLLWFNFSYGGALDGEIASVPGGIFSRLEPGETVMTDGASTYVGAPQCRAPPHRGMSSYIEEFDRAELSLQRLVERINHLLREFKILKGPFRCSPGDPDFVKKASAATSACCKLLSMDQLLNPERY